MDDAPARRALVVDDDPLSAEAVAGELRRRGFTAETADSVAAARARLEDFAPELVVCDLRMPGEDGLEFLREIREKKRGIVFVVLTAFGSLPEVWRASRFQANGFVKKSLPLRTVGDTLLSILERKG